MAVQEWEAARCCVERISGNRSPFLFFFFFIKSPFSCSLGPALLLLGDMAGCKMNWKGVTQSTPRAPWGCHAWLWGLPQGHSPSEMGSPAGWQRGRGQQPARYGKGLNHVGKQPPEEKRGPSRSGWVLPTTEASWRVWGGSGWVRATPSSEVRGPRQALIERRGPSSSDGQQNVSTALTCRFLGLHSRGSSVGPGVCSARCFTHLH